jgi:hypothetical protein
MSNFRVQNYYNLLYAFILKKLNKSKRTGFVRCYQIITYSVTSSFSAIARPKASHCASVSLFSA